MELLLPPPLPPWLLTDAPGLRITAAPPFWSTEQARLGRGWAALLFPLPSLSLSLSASLPLSLSLTHPPTLLSSVCLFLSLISLALFPSPLSPSLTYSLCVLISQTLSRLIHLCLIPRSCSVSSCLSFSPLTVPSLLPRSSLPLTSPASLSPEHLSHYGPGICTGTGDEVLISSLINLGDSGVHELVL